MESSLKLEEGKFYRRRDGQVVGPAMLDLQFKSHNWLVGGLRYFIDGWYLPSKESSLDLVAEVPQDDLARSPAERLVVGGINRSGGAWHATLPTDSKERKDTPIYSGVLAYFPRAMAEIAKVSKIGNDKHNPGQPLHWSKGKSNDHADCAARHLIEHGTIDADDGCRHSAKLAWRALALLETELEAAQSSSLD